MTIAVPIRGDLYSRAWVDAVRGKGSRTVRSAPIGGTETAFLYTAEFPVVSGGPSEQVIPNQFAFLMWESPSNYGQPIVIQAVLLYRFPEFIYEK